MRTSLLLIVLFSACDVELEPKPESEGERVTRALDELTRRPEAHHIATTVGWTAHSVSTDEYGATHVGLDLSFHGRPVYGRHAAMIVEADGSVSPRPGDAIEPPPLEMPAIGEAEALSAAYDDEIPENAHATLAYRRSSRGYDLIYRVEDGSDDNFEIDAMNGEVRRRFSNILHANPPIGETQFSGNMSLSTETLGLLNYRLCDKLRAKNAGNCTVSDYDANGNYIVYASPNLLQPYVDSNNDWGNHTALPATDTLHTLTATGQTAAADASFGVMVAWDLWQNVFNRAGPWNDRTPVTIHVHHHYERYGQPFYDSAASAGDLYFGDPQSNGAASFTEPDVVGHELGHLVFGNYTPLNDCSCDPRTGACQSCELGGLCESFGDLSGTMSEFYLRGGGYATHSHTLPASGGDWIFGDKDPSYPHRYLDLPHLDGVNLDYDPNLLNPWSCKTEIHGMVGPPNRAFFIMSQGAPQYTGGLGDDPHASQFLHNGVQGLGIDLAGRLEYEAAALFPNYDSTYYGWRQAVLEAAARNHGGGYGPVYKVVEDAFGGVGTGRTADRQPPQISMKVTSSATAASVDASVTDDRWLNSAVTLLLDGAPVTPTVSNAGTTMTVSYKQPTTGMTVGTHRFHLDVEDGEENHATQDGTFSVDVAPTVTLSQSGDPRQPTLTATVTDALGPSAIARVDLLLAGTVIGTASVAPYQFRIDTRSWSDGPHTVTATVWNQVGLSGSTSLSVIADNTGPTVTFTVGASGPPYLLTASASDLHGVTRAQFYAGTELLSDQHGAGPFTASYTPHTNPQPDTLQVLVTDGWGNVSTTSAAAPKDTDPPVIAATAHIFGHAVTIELGASDPCGIAWPAAAFYDGVEVAQPNASPFLIQLTAVPDGTHQMSFLVADRCGNVNGGTFDFVMSYVPEIIDITRDDTNKKKPKFTVLLANESEVDHIEALVDGTPSQTVSAPPWQFTIDTSNMTDGSHEVHFKVYDQLGAVAEDFRSVDADNTGPQLGWAVSGTLSSMGITAQPVDIHGTSAVDFHFGAFAPPAPGYQSEVTLTSPPWVAYWAPRSNVSGQDYFCVDATDGWGNPSSLCRVCDFDPSSSAPAHCVDIPQ